LRLWRKQELILQTLTLPNQERRTPMHILVLNGSPKGKYSITLQTVHYLSRLCPAHEFEILHVGQRIRALEKNFTPAKEMLERADLILFSYPVYTFIAPSQELREQMVRNKLNPIRRVIEGKRVVLLDDSIVRGTQLKDNVKMLFDYGAKEVHMRIACPPLIYGCPFLGFSSSKTDLELMTRRIIKDLEGDENKDLEKYADPDSIQHRRMVQRIADMFGLTSLEFNRVDTLVKAIGLPKCKICTHCFDGSSHF
jgi:hypothetical protein